MGCLEYILILSPILLTFIVSIKKDKHETPSTFFSKQTWNCYDIIYLLILFLLIRYISWVLVWKGVISLYQLNSYGTSFLLLPAGVFLYIILRFKYGLKISTLGLSLDNSMPNFVIGLRISFMFGFICFFGASVIGVDQVLVDKSRWFHNVRVLEMAWDQLFVFFFATVVAAPIVEESVFRGFMYLPFSRKIGHKGAMFVTSLVWAIWHSVDMKSISGVFIAGIIFAYFYVKTQSLIPSIIVHSMNNLTMFITLLYLWLFQNNILSINSNKFIMFMGLFFLLGFIILSIISRQMLLKPVVPPKNTIRGE